jgi:hypothetical protein
MEPRQVLPLALPLSLFPDIADIFAFNSLPMKLHLKLRVKRTYIFDCTKPLDFKVN